MSWLVAAGIAILVGGIILFVVFALWIFEEHPSED